MFCTPKRYSEKINRKFAARCSILQNFGVSNAFLSTLQQFQFGPILLKKSLKILKNPKKLLFLGLNLIKYIFFVAYARLRANAVLHVSPFHSEYT